ncbi:alkane oxidation protein activator PraB [Pseudomonas mangiferae]|uniref:Protein activator n=1 Tax=Pseudomonas mangiferae TaxID=2593654 RepID=A0A553H4B8_9PSED|nr:alkane oxidation protein activator PraB [Pseudomonas mangiferae]TRX76564.1 protein activator [Pseudomonas mangiferae]
MKAVQTFVSATALVLCAAASAVSAATIAPAGASFTAPGTITVRSPASLQQPVTCNITFTGKVAANGSSASITSATVSGSNSLCKVPQMKNLPWTLTATSVTTGTVTGVAFSILSSNCGPGTVSAAWSNATNTLSAANQALSGNCTITNLSVKPSPAFTVSP